jgi:hypothetical protein
MLHGAILIALYAWMVLCSGLRGVDAVARVPDVDKVCAGVVT